MLWLNIIISKGDDVLLKYSVSIQYAWYIYIFIHTTYLGIHYTYMYFNIYAYTLYMYLCAICF